jgi:signal transduction histidine kinase
MSEVRVLLVGEPRSSGATERHLREAGFDVRTVGGAKETLEALEEGTVDCIVSDYEVPDEDGLLFLGGLGVLRAVREEYPDVSFILFTDVGNEEIAREAIAAGVTDYIRRGRGGDTYQRLVDQVDNVVARRRAETRASRQAHVTEVIRDINQTLVRADSRRQIEQSVAQRLAESGQYVMAWIAEVEDDAVALRAMGVEGAAIEGGGAIDISDDTAYTEPVRLAADERRPVVVEDPTVGAWEAALDRTPVAVAAIPFVYENRVYGVLVVYTDREDAFDDEERHVLAEVGENVAYAMNAVAVRRKFTLREAALRRQNERLEEFAEVVSHDLRNPLTVARGSIDLLEADGVQVERIEDSLGRMESIIDDVLTLARQGKRVGETEAVDLGAAARNAWGNVDTPHASLETDGRRVEADRSRLVQLLENLFRNAIEHASPDTVRVVGTDHGFAVEDDGPGLPEGEREELFEHGHTTSEEGTGFGLAIVRSIAEAHGWSVTATDGTDGGARFAFTGVDVPDDEAPASPVFGGSGDGGCAEDD